MSINAFDLGAEQATETRENRPLFGKIDIGSRVIVFPGGGQRPVEYDPEVHTDKKPTAEFEFTLTPIDEMEIAKVFTRSMISWSAEWKQATYPSIVELGIKPEELVGKWVKLQIVEIDETFTDRKTGKERAKTSFSFQAAYDTLAECRKAFHAENGTEGDPVMDIDMDNKPANKPEQPSDEAIKQFAPALVLACNGDMAVLDNSLKAFGIDHTHEIINAEILNALQPA